MITVRLAAGADEQSIRDLFWEYLQWANARGDEEFGVSFDIASMLEADMANLEIFSPPGGRMAIAEEGGEFAGIGCLKRQSESVGEIKRMYLRPQFRGKGAGRKILEKLIDEAKTIGYARIRLDSAGFMHEAHSLYRSAGFAEILPYPESEIPKDFHRHWIFMEKALQTPPSGTQSSTAETEYLS